MVILFDAANTLIHKPKFFEKFYKVLQTEDYDVDIYDLKRNHKILSESIVFPDNTSKDFYQKFNAELLYSLGIIPNDQLHQKIYESCSNLPWEVFEDVRGLQFLKQEKIVVSNFRAGLNEILNDLCPNLFSNVFASENFSFRKPDIEFYTEVLEYINVPASEIVYVGDSLKLDIEPARKLGVKAYLIDREYYYPSFVDRIETMDELINLVGNEN